MSEEMGLNSLGVTGLVTFGIKVIYEVLILS
jgi:hypothetical protein